MQSIVLLCVVLTNMFLFPLLFSKYTTVMFLFKVLVMIMSCKLCSGSIYDKRYRDIKNWIKITCLFLKSLYCFWELLESAKLFVSCKFWTKENHYQVKPSIKCFIYTMLMSSERKLWFEAPAQLSFFNRSEQIYVLTYDIFFFRLHFFGLHFNGRSFCLINLKNLNKNYT